MASALPPWVILGSVTVSGSGESFSVSLQAPPRVALITTPHRFDPDDDIIYYASVVATDPSGLLLLHADKGNAEADVRRRYKFTRQKCADYVVLNAVKLTEVPISPSELVMNPGHLGLLVSQEGENRGKYIVAELQSPGSDSDEAALLCFRSDHDDEQIKKIFYPLTSARPLVPNGVVSHLGRLWWIDLSWCLLTCDPFEEAPMLVVVDLPPGKELNYREKWIKFLHKWRCVGASDGKLRFVDMYKDNKNNQGDRQISVWTLMDFESSTWKLEFEVTFQAIWNYEGYKATGLGKKIPTLALIHPTNPSVVYFFMNKALLGVDLQASKVVECDVCKLVRPPEIHIDTRSVHPWELPPKLSGARIVDVSIDDINEEQSDEDWSEATDELSSDDGGGSSDDGGDDDDDDEADVDIDIDNDNDIDIDTDTDNEHQH